MNGRGLEDRDMDDIQAPDDFRFAQRLYAALDHPDCPVHMFDFEKKQLSRHMAIRLNRTKAYAQNASNAAAKALNFSGPGKGNGRKGVGIGPRV